MPMLLRLPLDDVRSGFSGQVNHDIRLVPFQEPVSRAGIGQVYSVMEWIGLLSYPDWLYSGWYTETQVLADDAGGTKDYNFH